MVYAHAINVSIAMAVTCAYVPTDGAGQAAEHVLRRLPIDCSSIHIVSTCIELRLSALQ
jgi:hypothetical protein